MTDKIIRANQYAREKHMGQLDDCGNPYFYHCNQVYNLLKIITDDEDVLCAGLLHDTIEDTETTYEELKKEFGVRIADLVHEVTHEGTNDSYGYYFPRIKTLEGELIKHCDTISNLSRMRGEKWNEKRIMHHRKKAKNWESEPPPKCSKCGRAPHSSDHDFYSVGSKNMCALCIRGE